MIRELDIYGRVRMEEGETNFVPFLFQGQYYDVETKLAYNRFRYYAPEWGMYITPAEAMEEVKKQLTITH